MQIIANLHQKPNLNLQYVNATYKNFLTKK